MNEKILITGANRGMGLKTTEILLKNNDSVIATARHPDSAPLNALKKEYPSTLTLEKLDLLNNREIDNLVSRCKRQGVSLKALVHNAGVYPGGESPEHEVSRLMQVNLFGPAALTDGLMPLLVEKARVISVSSGLGRLANFSSRLAEELLDPGLDETRVLNLAREYINGRLAGWPSDPYSVSKALLNALTRAWHRKYGDRFTFAAIDPGWVRTGMGGPGANLSVEEGVATTIWALTTEAPASGVFYHHKKENPW